MRKMILVLIGVVIFCNSKMLAQPIEQEETEKKVKQYCSEMEKICQQEKDINSVRQKTGESMRELAKISKQAVPYLINEFRDKKKDWKYRYFIFQQLAYTKDERIIEPAIESLNDEKDEIRGYSAVFLGEVKSKKAVKPLINRISDKNRHVRVASCIALGKINDTKAIKPILERFKKENDFVARTDFISYAFGRFKDESIYSQLVESLKNDVHPDVRASAAGILGKYGDKRAIEVLSNSLLNDEHPLVRFYSAISIGELGNKQDITFLEEVKAKEKSDFVKEEIKRAIIKVKGKTE